MENPELFSIPCPYYSKGHTIYSDLIRLEKEILAEILREKVFITCPNCERIIIWSMGIDCSNLIDTFFKLLIEDKLVIRYSKLNIFSIWTVSSDSELNLKIL